MPDMKQRSMATKHPKTPTKIPGRMKGETGSKFPSSPHQKEGKYEMCVGQQTKLKRF